MRESRLHPLELPLLCDLVQRQGGVDCLRFEEGAGVEPAIFHLLEAAPVYEGLFPVLYGVRLPRHQMCLVV